MGEDRSPDFSGYATKSGLKCTDGRTIMSGAFKHQDNVTVPLVWQHTHSSPENILGHGVLENRDDGVYVYGFFNETTPADQARALVEHGDIVSLSIYANQLVEQSKNVVHGFIREVSLVLSGANPGAFIDNVTLQHSDDEYEMLDDEAVIYTGLELLHEEGEGSDDLTIQDIYDDFTEDQKNVVHYLIGTALESGSAEHSGMGGSTFEQTNEQDEPNMNRNVFDSQDSAPRRGSTLSHDALRGIVEDAQRSGSLRDAFESYALAHGIDNIDILFPEAKNVTNTPEFDKRRTEWVSSVLGGTKKSPFTRIKSIVADITHDEARARGYIKGNLKKEEFFGLTKRVTSPTTIYKKQKLDRDDIIDITDFDVVMWLKQEMRGMLDEEIARAILVGDGRDVADEDKIRDPLGNTEGAGIRSIVSDHDLYAATLNVNLDDASSSPNEIVEAIVRGMRLYKGTGSPTFFTTLPTMTTLLLAKDTTGRRLYSTASELASAMGVANIVPVEILEGHTELVGIIVNLADYTVGTDKGGDINFFDDFDIDYNQYKYLIETRMSGALTKIRSALVVKKVAGANVLAAPVEPTFDDSDGDLVIPTTTGVVYKRADTNAVVTSASTITVAANSKLKIYAVPDTNYYFANNVEDEWTFSRR